MITETLDYKAVKYVFWCFLTISLVLVTEGSIHYFIDPDTLETADILATIFVHLIPCLYIPLVGLFCLSKNKYPVKPITAKMISAAAK